MNKYFYRTILCSFLLAAHCANASEIFVKENGSGSMSGKDWDNAFPGDSLVRLMYSAPQGTCIYVSEGLYNPYYAIYQSDGKKVMYDKDCAFIIAEGISVFGGYSSLSTGKLLNKRDTELYKTYLSGDMGCSMLSERTVIYRSGSVLDGCYVDGNLSSLTYSVELGQVAVYIQNGVLHLRSGKEISSVLLYDVYGKLIYTSNEKSFNMEVSLDNATNRILILSFVVDGETKVYKLHVTP